MIHRRGLTLLELLLVIGVIAVVLSLLVPAVMHVRATAARTESTNNLRQIVLATHHFAEVDQGRLPSIDGTSPNTEISLHCALLPYLDQPIDTLPIPFLFRVYLSPADPTVPRARAAQWEVTSYAVNAVAFENKPRLPATFRDGTSQTVAFAEHYAFDCQGVYFNYCDRQILSAIRRATFADLGDHRPEVHENLTFQVRPALKDCLPALAQAPHSAGMLVAMADGAVRILAPSMSAATYWGALTPAGRETLGADW